MQVYEKIVEMLDEYVKVNEINPTDNFKSDLDMSSFEIIGFTTDVRNAFGVKLDVDDYINNPTVGEMAEYIASKITKK